MSLPDFNHQGLLPEGLHLASEDEVKERCVDAFPDSTSRRPVFYGLCRYRAAAAKLNLNITQWVNGSFTDRTRLNPEDVDLVNFVRAEDVKFLTTVEEENIDALLDGEERTKAGFRCHSFLELIFPPGHKYADYFEGQRRYWSKQWSTPQDYSTPPLKKEAPWRGKKGILQMTVGAPSLVPHIDLAS
jgi:hypothetical protein